MSVALMAILVAYTHMVPTHDTEQRLPNSGWRHDLHPHTQSTHTPSIVRLTTSAQMKLHLWNPKARLEQWVGAGAGLGQWVGSRRSQPAE